MEQDILDRAVLTAVAEALESAKASKPNDRSPKDRAFAVLITDLEKALAWVDYQIVEGD